MLSDIVQHDNNDIRDLLHIYQSKLSEIDPRNMTFFEMEMYIRASMKILLLRQILDLISALDKSIQSLFHTFLRSSRLVEDPDTLEQLNEQLSIIISNIRQLYQVISDGRNQNNPVPMFNSLNIKGDNVDIQVIDGENLERVKHVLDEFMKNLNIFEGEE